MQLVDEVTWPSQVTWSPERVQRYNFVIGVQGLPNQVTWPADGYIVCMIECKSLTCRLGSAYTALSEQFHEIWIRKSKFWKLFFVIFLQNNHVNLCFRGRWTRWAQLFWPDCKAWGQKFDFRLRYQISIALDSHLKVSSLFFIALLLLYSLQFFSLELLDALHISTRTHLSSSGSS